MDWKVKFSSFVSSSLSHSLPTAEILSGKNARALFSMVLYLKKINENENENENIKTKNKSWELFK